MKLTVGHCHMGFVACLFHTFRLLLERLLLAHMFGCCDKKQWKSTATLQVSILFGWHFWSQHLTLLALFSSLISPFRYVSFVWKSMHTFSPHTPFWKSLFRWCPHTALWHVALCSLVLGLVRVDNLLHGRCLLFFQDALCVDAGPDMG